MNIIEGKYLGNDLKIGIVASRFNEFIVSKLIGGAEDCLLRHDVKSENIDLAWTSGAFEIPLGIATVSLQSGVPVMFGVLTTDNIEQAIERAGTKAGNKGTDCAMSVLEMINLMKQL